MSTSISLEDAEVNLKLALAIGYADRDVMHETQAFGHVHYTRVLRHGLWELFDYRHTRTIWPIAKRYNAFPLRVSGNELQPEMWAAPVVRGGVKIATITAPTAELAVARAVIEGACRG